MKFRVHRIRLVFPSPGALEPKSKIKKPNECFSKKKLKTRSLSHSGRFVNFTLGARHGEGSGGGGGGRRRSSLSTFDDTIEGPRSLIKKSTLNGDVNLYGDVTQ